MNFKRQSACNFLEANEIARFEEITEIHIHEELMCSYSLWDHFSIASKRVPGTKLFGNSKDSR